MEDARKRTRDVPLPSSRQLPCNLIRLATVEDLPSLADLYRQLNPKDEAIPPNQFAAVSEEILTPGVQLLGDARTDQARVATPTAAFASGASYVVMGRSIT